jgi:hypothetical protein
MLDMAGTHLGYAYALSGRISEGVTLIEEAVANPAVTGIVNHSLYLAHLGEAYLLAGRPDDATAVARRATDLARSACRTADVQLGKLPLPSCAVILCEKNLGVARDTVRRRGPV